MFVRIENKYDEKKQEFFYDVYVEDNCVGKLWPVQMLHEFLIKRVRDTDIIDCIIASGRKSKFTTAQLREQAKIGFQKFRDKYGSSLDA